MWYDTEKRKDVSIMFGIRLCYLRCHAGLTQNELGRRLGLSGSAFGMYEQGRRTPSLGIIIAISEEFKVSTNYLLTGQAMNEHEESLEQAIRQYAAIGGNIPTEYNYPSQHNPHNAIIRRLISLEY